MLVPGTTFSVYVRLVDAAFRQKMKQAGHLPAKIAGWRFSKFILDGLLTGKFLKSPLKEVQKGVLHGGA